jgi:hypothetical protein
MSDKLGFSAGMKKGKLPRCIVGIIEIMMVSKSNKNW